MSLYESLTRVLAPFAEKIKGIQTGYDGTTYSSPGEAVRTQISDLHVLIGDEPGTAIQGEAVSYDGTESGLTATTVQDAIDENAANVSNTNERLQEKADKYTVSATFERGLYSGSPVVGEAVNLTPADNAAWERTKVEVKEGDAITLHGSASTNTKLATFTDSEGIVLRVTTVGTPANPVEYTMPSDGYVYMSAQKAANHYMTIMSADGFNVIKEAANGYTDAKVAEVSADMTHLTDTIYGETEVCAITNGTAPNSGNANCVCTEDYIEVTPGNTVALIVKREMFDPTNHYAYGWRTYNSEKGTVKTKDVASTTTGENVVAIPDGVAYIRFTIAEFDSTDTVVTLRKTNFAEGDVFVCKDYANSIIGLTDKEEEEESGLISFNDSKVKAKCDEFAAKLKSTDKAETFLFVTDPHVMGKNNIFDDANFAIFESYMNEMKAYYSCLPFEFLLDGGDWLNVGDYKVTAMEKLGYVDATFKSVFGPGVRKPLVGNHDTNEQGYEDEQNTETASGRLSTNQLMLAWFGNERKCYYTYDGFFTRFFFLDTNSDKSDAMNAYRWEQIDWLGKALESNTKDYAVVAMHIFRNVNITQMANNVTALASAYNSRGTVTLNSITYDFSSATGKFSFVIAGHTHIDDNVVQDGIPVIYTKKANALGDAGATFDMCVVDYAQSKIEMVRVGSGASRSISILT